MSETFLLAWSNPRMREKMTEAARGAGLPLARFLQQFFEAAYCARFAPPTGDLALDAAMAKFDPRGAPPNQGSGAMPPDRARHAAELADLRAKILEMGRSAAASETRLAAARDDAQARANERDALRAEVDALRRQDAGKAPLNVVALPVTPKFTHSEPMAHRPKIVVPGVVAGADLKIMRGYASAGWTLAEIARETGQPVDVVRVALKLRGA